MIISNESNNDEISKKMIANFIAVDNLIETLYKNDNSGLNYKSFVMTILVNTLVNSFVFFSGKNFTLEDVKEFLSHIEFCIMNYQKTEESMHEKNN